MRQKTLIAFTYALASITVFSSNPASASTCEPSVLIPCSPQNETVPEPGTILGTMLIGSTMAWQKFNKSKKAHK